MWKPYKKGGEEEERKRNKLFHEKEPRLKFSLDFYVNLNCESIRHKHINSVTLWTSVKPMKILFYIHFWVEIRLRLGTCWITRDYQKVVPEKLAAVKSRCPRCRGSRGTRHQKGAGDEVSHFPIWGMFFVTEPYCFNVQCFHFETSRGNTVQL